MRRDLLQQPLVAVRVEEADEGAIRTHRNLETARRVFHDAARRLTLIVGKSSLLREQSYSCADENRCEPAPRVDIFFKKDSSRRGIADIGEGSAGRSGKGDIDVR